MALTGDQGRCGGSAAGPENKEIYMLLDITEQLQNTLSCGCTYVVYINPRLGRAFADGRGRRRRRRRKRGEEEKSMGREIFNSRVKFRDIKLKFGTLVDDWYVYDIYSVSFLF